MEAIYVIQFYVWAQEHPGDAGFLYTELKVSMGYFSDKTAAEEMLESLGSSSYRLVKLLPAS